MPSGDSPQRLNRRIKRGFFYLMRVVEDADENMTNTTYGNLTEEQKTDMYEAISWLDQYDIEDDDV